MFQLVCMLLQVVGGGGGGEGGGGGGGSTIISSNQGQINLNDSNHISIGSNSIKIDRNHE